MKETSSYMFSNKNNDFMRLTHIEFESYKTFSTKEKVQIRPITLVVGRNSSGKSALSKLPLLMANSFLPSSEEPISVHHNGVDFGGSFTDLIHNKYPHGSLKIKLFFSEKIQLSFEIQNIANTPLQFIKTWSVSSPEFSANFEIELKTENTLLKEELRYSDGGQIFLITFHGLIPVKIYTLNGESYQTDFFSNLANQLEIFANGVEYIGPYRKIPSRIYFNSGRYPKRLGVMGENAPVILGTSSYTDDTVLKAVGDWYEKFLGGWRVEVVQNANSFELALVKPHNPAVKVNVVDVGQGMSQVLPLIVRCLTKNRPNEPITIIEQPELHLHPAAHGDLAELFARKAKSEGSSFILETHSENFLLRIRRLVVEKILNPDDVIIYWIDDLNDQGGKLKEIYVDENGDISEWPKGVFSEDLEEVLAIRKAQRDANAN
ncbi:MAG: DUF3696 domain-containing protein [Chitinophagaceae bacterium]|nr:MAG: DUF3696 domain-containing protein [Chitinophagaceae bacterium]